MNTMKTSWSQTQVTRIKSLKRQLRMVANPFPKGQMMVGQRISQSKVMDTQDERKMMETIANGKMILSQWDAVKRNTAQEYHVFVGVFENGEYKGRCSTWHRWYLSEGETAGEDVVCAASPVPSPLLLRYPVWDMTFSEYGNLNGWEVPS